MESLGQLMELLDEKRKLFLSFTQETEELLFCNSADMEKKLEIREKLIKKIDGCDQEINSLLGDDSQLDAAVHTSCKRGDLSKEYQLIYDKAMSIRAVWGQLSDLNKQVEMRMEQEREETLEQIKSANRGQGAQAARYYHSMGSKSNGESQLGKA